MPFDVEFGSKIKKRNMAKHFGLTCLAYMFIGIVITVQQLGIKSGIGWVTTTIIFSSSLIFFVVIVFTSMQKVKNVLFNNDKSE